MPIEIKIVGDNTQDLLAALQDIQALFSGVPHNVTVQDSSPKPVTVIEMPMVPVAVPPTEDGARLKEKALKVLLKHWDLEHVKEGAVKIQKQFDVKRLREVPEDKGRDLMDAVEKLIAAVPQGEA